MLTNYLKIALRNMWKHRTYAAINIGGLAFALTCCLLIMLFIRDEFSYDRFHTDADQIYRVAVREDYGENKVFHNTTTPIALGPALQANYPEIDAMVRIAVVTDLVKRDDQVFTERVHLVDPAFFDVFDFKMVESRTQNPIWQRDSIVLTESMATKYFGTEDPVGKTLSVQIGDNFVDYAVAGVAYDSPSNSSIRFDFLMSFESGDLRWGKRAFTSFFNVIPETYIRLPVGTAIDDLRTKVIALGEKIMGDDEGVFEIQFQSLTDIHLNTYYPTGLEVISDPQLSYILATVALLILIIACINFITLAISRAADRAKEVGIRKVVGARQSQLMRQFWGETLIMSMAAMTLAILLANVLLPVFNQLSGKALDLPYDGLTLLLIGGVLIATGCIAGGYPALVLSGFTPYEALKGIARTGSAGGLRWLLTVAQFTLSIVLMIAALMMQQQLGYLRSKPLGYDRDHVVVLPTGQSHSETLSLLERFRNTLSNHQAVQQVSASSSAFGEGWRWIGYTDAQGDFRSLYYSVVDHEFLSTMGLKLVQGRDFARDRPSDTERAILVNEALVAEYGWNNSIGQKLSGEFEDHQVIGVVRDFHYKSLHTPIEPVAIAMNFRTIRSGASDGESRGSSPGSKLSVRISPGHIPETMALLETTWKQVAPSLPFNFYFVDDAVDQQYRQEERLESIVDYAALFAILIACMGLFGLVTLTTGKRIKEIGVRRVLGATIPSIVMLIAKDFIRLIVVAFILAVPLAYLAVQQWLQGFAFRTEIAPGVFLLVGILTVLIAVVTISYQAIRAARRNPVEALRYE